MRYQKYKADQIFNGHHFLPTNQVLICEESGKIEAIVNEEDAGEDILSLMGILTPGFVNCHCHLELSHMKGLIPEKTGLVDFVLSIVAQRHFAEDEIKHAIDKAEKEMLANGIVAVGDICNNLLTINQKSEGNLHYHNFIEVSGWLPQIAEQRMLKSKDYYNYFSILFSTSIVPHAPYSVSNELWKLLRPLYKNKIVSLHNQETAFEDELFQQKTGDFIRMYDKMKLDTSFYQPSGKSSIQTYFPHLLDAEKIILVHNTFTKEGDIHYVQETGRFQDVSFCICINANLYIEQYVPPIELFRKNGCKLVIGTDSLASNNSLNMIDEMKTIQSHFPTIPLKEMLQWATINGAEALNMSNTLGSFEKGKKPGILLLTGIEKHTLSASTSVKRIK